MAILLSHIRSLLSHPEGINSETTGLMKATSSLLLYLLMTSIMVNDSLFKKRIEAGLRVAKQDRLTKGYERGLSRPAL